MREDLNKITYDEEDMSRIEPTPCLNLPDIVEDKCMEPDDGSPYRVFFCSGTKPWRNRACRKCGSINIRSLGNTPEPRLVHDVNVGITQVDIVLKVDRYQCNDCGESFSRQFDGILEKRQMTSRLYEQIKREAFRSTFTDVSNHYGYSDTTIANIFDEYAAELEAERGAIVAPRVLGIDEKHIVHDMRAIFVDIETGELLEMRPTNKRDEIMGTIESMVDYDKNIRVVTMDMANGYKAYVEECLPYAKIIVDKYHVFQDLQVKTKRTRSLLLETIKAQIEAEEDEKRKGHLIEVRNLVANDSYLFKFSAKKIRSEKNPRRSVMADVCKTFPEFNHLRLLKEGFERIYDCDNRADAERRYYEWTQLVPPTGAAKLAAWREKYKVDPELFQEFRVFFHAMEKWNKEVFNYFDETEDERRYTNAAAEGMNRLIQSMNDMGNGYSFDRLRARALFWDKAGKRISYGFNKKSVKKQRAKITTGFMDFKSPRNFLPEYETYYEDVDFITACEEEKDYKPTSVLSYWKRARKENPEGYID